MPDSGRLARRDLLLLAGVLALVYVASPFAIEGDGAPRYRALTALLATGTLDRAPYSLVGPLFSAPLWWIGTALGAAEWWVGRYNFVLFALALLALHRLLAPAIGARATARFLLLLAAASMFPHHLGRYYGEVFSALTIAVGLAAVCVRGAYWGWLLAALGAANTPAALPAVALAATAWSWRARDARHLLPVAAAALLIVGEAWLRRGGPFVTGYEGVRGAETVLPFSGRPGFSYPFVYGVLSLLLSFGKGLLFFAPGIMLARIGRSDQAALTGLAGPMGPVGLQAGLRSPPTGGPRDLLALWLLVVVGLVLVYAKWWSWYGGVFWGPRFLLFASMPAALALALWTPSRSRARARDVLAMAAILWSCWVGANGLVWRGYGLDVCTADHYALELLCWYVPEFSTLFGPLTRSRPLDPLDLTVLASFGLLGVFLAVHRSRGSTRA